MKSIILILDNIRSTYNVGSILRTADGFGITEVLFAGYTPYPILYEDPRLPHESRKITNAIHKTALGAEQTIDSKLFDTTKLAIKYAKTQGFRVAALEQAENSTNITEYKATEKTAIVLGNEVNGISSDTLALCDVIIEIPMFGRKESFNVSISAALCLYSLKLGAA